MDTRITIRDLKKAMQQHNDIDSVLIRVGIDTSYRIDKCQISSTKYDSSLFHATSIDFEKVSNSLILNLE